MFSLFHNDQIQHGEIWTNYASTNRLPPALSISPAIPTEARGTCNKHHYYLNQFHLPNITLKRNTDTTPNTAKDVTQVCSLQTTVEQKTNTAGSQHSLLHGKTLLVAATHNLEHISLELLLKTLKCAYLSFRSKENGG